MTVFLFRFRAVLFINKTCIPLDLNCAMIFHLGNIFFPLWGEIYHSTYRKWRTIFQSFIKTLFNISAVCLWKKKCYGKCSVYHVFFFSRKGRIMSISKRDSWQAWYVTLHLGKDIIVTQFTVVNSRYDLSNKGKNFIVINDHGLSRYSNLRFCMSPLYCII